MNEEELVLLFETIEAIIDERAGYMLGRDTLTETIRASALKQDCINVIAFGETLEE